MIACNRISYIHSNENKKFNKIPGKKITLLILKCYSAILWRSCKLHPWHSYANTLDMKPKLESLQNEKLFCV